MKVIKSPDVCRKLIFNLKKKGKRISFVPTMGALHEGHLSLIRAARKAGDVLVVSIFVNPAQFGPKEDYRQYPRPFLKDKKLVKQHGVDIIFCPTPARMYPEGHSTYVIEEKLSKCMCGRTRPGHFRGVTTIVLKLFNIVQPDVVFFGQKDAQQAVIIKRMVRDLNLPLHIKILPIVRESDGLALSSRNQYLSVKERSQALCLRQALRLVRQTRNLNKGRNLIKKNKSVKVEYLVAVDRKTLQPVKKIGRGTLLAVAARVGKTRLIDNLIVN